MATGCGSENVSPVTPSRSTRGRWYGPENKRRPTAAIVSRCRALRAISRSTEAPRRASMVPNSRASSSAAVAPTCRIPSPNNSRREAVALSTRRSRRPAARRSSRRSAPAVKLVGRQRRKGRPRRAPGRPRPAGRCVRTRGRGCPWHPGTRSGPDPFELPAGAGDVRAVVRDLVLVAHDRRPADRAQRSASATALSAPVRFSGTGPMICGITSPARLTCTLSPIRRSFAG